MALASSTLQSRESVLLLSSLECTLKREVEEGRAALDKMSTLNWALASDRTDLNKQLLQVMLLSSPRFMLLVIGRMTVCMHVRFQMEHELSDSQSQLEALRSEVISLQREVKNLDLDCNQLRLGWDLYKPCPEYEQKHLVLMMSNVSCLVKSAASTRR